MAQLNNDEDYDFLVSQHFSDLVLFVENTKFYVHKCILSMSSPKFKEMIASDGNQIILSSQRKEEFAAFLRVIYSDVISQGNQINDINTKFLLKLADEYQVVKVKHLCCKFLFSSVKESNCLGIYKLAEEYNLEDVMEKCAEVASFKPCCVLESSEEFLGLNTESKLRVYAKRAKYFDENVKDKWVIPPQAISPSSIRESLR